MLKQDLDEGLKINLKNITFIFIYMYIYLQIKILEF